MKHTKRLLAVLLSLLLSLALLAPAVSAVDAPDPNAPILTKQPEATYYLKVGNALTLELEAELPAGVTGDISYAWYTYNWAYHHEHGGEMYEAIAVGPTLETPVLTWTDLLIDILSSGESTRYYAVAVNTYIDENDETQIAYTQCIVEVFAVPLDLGQLGSWGPLLMGLYGMGSLLLSPVSLLGLLLVPFSFLLGPMGPMFLGPLFAPAAGLFAAVKYFWGYLFG